MRASVTPPPSIGSDTVAFEHGPGLAISPLAFFPFDIADFAQVWSHASFPSNSVDVSYMDQNIIGLCGRIFVCREPEQSGRPV
jgi:hypothetical protein